MRTSRAQAREPRYGARGSMVPSYRARTPRAIARREAPFGTKTTAQRAPGAAPHGRPVSTCTAREPSQIATAVFGGRMSATARSANAMRSKLSDELSDSSSACSKCSISIRGIQNECNSTSLRAHLELEEVADEVALLVA